MQERIKQTIESYPLHDSLRGHFGFELYKQMAKDERILIVTADLGYGLFDLHKNDYPDRFLNVGAAEQVAMGVAIGLAETGKIPFIYSITTFLLYRPFELIRNYINHENIHVKIIGSGYGHDYSHDGFSHWPDDQEEILKAFPNILTHFPQTKEEIPGLVEEVVSNQKPTYINLRR